MLRRFLPLSLKQAQRLVVAVIGGTILAVGIAMLVLPGPAFIVIPLGLALLATEFVWARKLLSWVRTRTRRMAPGHRGTRRPD